MATHLFGGFKRCSYTVQECESHAERKLAVIPERDPMRWFKPARGRFQIVYRQGPDHPEYQPDFVAEAGDAIRRLEPRAAKQLTDPVVLAKKEAAVRWCEGAANHAATPAGKPWRYALIPHDAIAENMTLAALAQRYGK